MGVFAAILLGVSVTAYIFWPQRSLVRAKRRSRLDYLQERREVVYENIRDLRFEYGAGKHPESDFLRQRAALEDEAATILAEIDVLETVNGQFAQRAEVVPRNDRLSL